MALKCENIATIFSSFNPYPSLLPVATEDRKQFQCPNIVLNNKTGPGDGLPPMWPGFKSRRRRHMWVEFVVGSLPCSERFFSGYSGFPLSSKTNISKFQFDQESGRRRTTLWMCYLKIIIYLFLGISIDAKTLSSF